MVVFGWVPSPWPSSDGCWEIAVSFGHRRSCCDQCRSECWSGLDFSWSAARLWFSGRVYLQFFRRLWPVLPCISRNKENCAQMGTVGGDSWRARARMHCSVSTRRRVSRTKEPLARTPSFATVRPFFATVQRVNWFCCCVFVGVVPVSTFRTLNGAFLAWRSVRCTTFLSTFLYTNHSTAVAHEDSRTRAAQVTLFPAVFENSCQAWSSSRICTSSRTSCTVTDVLCVQCDSSVVRLQDPPLNFFMSV